MKLTEKKLKDIIVSPGYVSERDFNSAAERAKKEGIRIQSILVNEDIIKDEHLGRLIAEDFKYKFVQLRNEKIEPQFYEMVPETMARSKGAIVFGRDEDGIKVAMSDPDDLETRHMIEKRVGENVIPFYATRNDLEESFNKYYSSSLKDEFVDIFKKLGDETLTREDRDETTVKMVNLLLLHGYRNNSSDIHIEPYLRKILVRFRIDGVLHDVLEIPKEYYEFILTRIKIMAKMRTDEHRAAQDGRFTFVVSSKETKSEPERADIRISIVPVTQGENIVMRILSSKTRRFSLSDLGFSASDMKKVNRAINHPHGMILITGPTGSGKTTTSYAVMKILNTRDIHISTIEDPVEYDVEGISQIQVNVKTNLSFANGLRAIVRQDPDIILVGEIRDQETAGIAVNSAMTGHLVLSTLHANDASTTLPRLVDMKIEPFLVASTVNMVIAQRLIRRICFSCRVSYKITSEERKLIETNNSLKVIFDKKHLANTVNIRFYKGEGCNVCGNTGYSGRVGIFEVLEMSETMKDMVLKRARSDEIFRAAKETGMNTMLEDGVNKVLEGVTTLEEILRVTTV